MSESAAQLPLLPRVSVFFERRRRDRPVFHQEQLQAWFGQRIQMRDNQVLRFNIE